MQVSEAHQTAPHEYHHLEGDPPRIEDGAVDDHQREDDFRTNDAVAKGSASARPELN